MPKYTTSERLKQIMNLRNLKQIDIVRLAEPYCKIYKVKMGRNAVSQYVSGKVLPRQNALFILGQALNVSEAWLMGFDVPMERITDEAETNLLNDDLYNTYDNIFPITTKKLPLLGEIACGQPIFASEERESYVEVGTHVKADFCLKAKGDSMINARIFDGDIVFIRKQPSVENGDIAAVVIDDEATLKRVYLQPDKHQLMLVAENTAYAPLVFIGEELEHIHILGKAVAFQGDVK